LIVPVYRIVKKKHASDAFSGEEARLYGGRWNHPGVRVVYVAGSRALGALELLAHLENAALLDHYVVFTVDCPRAKIEELEGAKLPRRWWEDPAPEKVREIGDKWAKAAKSLILRVPSAVIPAEPNYLLNPVHPGFQDLKISKPEPFRIDARLPLASNRG
jgi:RES domain-containing protein